MRNPVDPAQSYYFSLGGCHRCVSFVGEETSRLDLSNLCCRYEAHKRLGKETIRGKIIEVPASVMKMHLGSSAPF